MIELPSAPKGPTVYVITESPGDTSFHDLVAAGIKALGAGPCAIEDIAVGPDTGSGDRASVLQFLQDEYNARGALVVGQAGAFFDDRADGYDTIDEDSLLLGEVGVIVRRPGELRATAPRLGAAAATADALLSKATGELLILGANDHARALAAAVATGRCAAQPSKITLSSTDAKDLTEARARLAQVDGTAQIEIRHVENASEHDRLLALMPPGSAIFNVNRAVDASPVSTAALFPENSTVCDLLAPLGASRFLSEAVRQRAGASLTVHDHTVYRAQRAISVLHAMFGAAATDRQVSALRKAVNAHFG